MRLSIVIRKTSDVTYFEDTLASILANRPDHCEVVVLCPGGYDDPYGLAGEVRFCTVPRGEQLPAMLNRVLPELRGDVVHVVDSGIRVTEGWATRAVAQFAESQVAAVTPVITTPDGTRAAGIGVRLGATGVRKVVAAGRRLGARVRAPGVLGPSLQAAFYSRKVLYSSGGFDESAGHWQADLDFALTLQRAGYRNVVVTDCRVTAAERNVQGVSGFEEGRQSERLFWKHRESFAELAWHPVAVLLHALVSTRQRRALGVIGGHCVGAVQRSRRGLAVALPPAADADTHARLRSVAPLRSENRPAA